MTSDSQRVFRPDAALAALLWPGLGHIRLGQTRRGLLIMAGLLLLILGGTLVGGVDSVDRKENWLWFLAQAPCGPIVLAIDYLNQAIVKKPGADEMIRSIAHVNEMGTLFIALAGLLNVVVILDALHYAPPRPDRRDSDRPAGDPWA